MIKWLIKRFCKHHFVKTWSRKENGYVMQCTKCSAIKCMKCGQIFFDKE